MEHAREAQIAIQVMKELLFLDALKLSRFLFKDKSENTFIYVLSLRTLQRYKMF